MTGSDPYSDTSNGFNHGGTTFIGTEPQQQLNHARRKSSLATTEVGEEEKNRMSVTSQDGQQRESTYIVQPLV